MLRPLKMRLMPLDRPVRFCSEAMLCLFLCTACQGAPPPLTPISTQEKKANTTPLDPRTEAQIWRAHGTRITDGAGQEITMRGIAFGNEVWSHTAIPSAHHTEADYQVVASMGMNVVRFYLSYHTFEDDSQPFEYKQSGWDWLDQNVEWAKKHQVRLILNMHDPVGGYQSLGEGKGLWTNEDNQERFVALWRAIAERYRAEPTIAGLDLLNEPVTTERIQQWKKLAERTVSEIRQVNQHHMVFVERVNAVAGDWAENEERNFFLISDPNVVYEFHFYKPFHFTHQGAEWVSFAARESWYPEENTPEVDWFQLNTVTSVESAPIDPQSGEWTLLETQPYVVSDPKIVIGKPFLVCDDAGPHGKATFDSLSLTRIDDAASAASAPSHTSRSKSAQEPEPVTQFEMDLDTIRGWYFWRKNEEQGQARFDMKGHGDSSALSIEHTLGPANLGADPLRFFAQRGSEYVLRALAKGQGLDPKARCLIRLEFYSSKVPVLPRGRDYLEQELDAYLGWGREKNVPVFLGEFGTIRDSFLPERGGLTWVSDMLDLLIEKDVSFTYHAYHEMPFGLFLGGETLPTQHRLYLPLYDLFVSKLGGNRELPWELEEPNQTSTLDSEAVENAELEAASEPNSAEMGED